MRVPHLHAFQFLLIACVACGTHSAKHTASPTHDASTADDAGASHGDGDAQGDGDSTHHNDRDSGTTAPTSDAGTHVDTDSGQPQPSDILVPAHGALIGQFYGADDIPATGKKLGRTLPLHLTYYDFTANWVEEETNADLAGGRIPFVNWEVFDTPLDEILSGQHDDMLAQRAADAKALGKQFFLDFGAEMNGDWSPWGGAQNGMSPDKYIAAYRHVHDALKDVDNAVWVWCPNVADEPAAAWNKALGYYPGDAYVDWACVDGYNWGNAGGDGWQSFKDVFADIYPLLVSLNKPIMIGEMASAEVGGDKAAWIDEIVPTLRDDYPQIKGLIWFDINKETDWRISSSPASEAAFKRMIADPYFNP